ncbi:hypothetical protein N0V93_007640 [Gnomoniopsis smithogilvyi]|uniref:NAD-dependent epimerase/dehydratase domain-containing protein n=1 Tax=Gnomoniopsis smithogilvyi TaxID=1191159 RepID=A0A9W8YRZ9_9PEZI|nr:hypothetical protein N0V93_007640 [Gnomoniopsis smithogilvyi]
MSSHHLPKNVLVTGANGYIGNAVARAFVRAGWTTYGLIRSVSASHALAIEEILPVTGSIDDLSLHETITGQLPSSIDTIVSVTEDFRDYVTHYNNIVALLRNISAMSAANGIIPLVIFTSGCKDYGIGPHFADDPDLAPHTEEDAVNPPSFLQFRAHFAQKIFENSDAFSPVLVRPTNVHGRSSSYYGLFFEVAQKAAESGKPLVMTSRPETICHSLHVDDCGDAYVAIASHPRPTEVKGQVFNISARRYETVAQLGQALVSEYNIAQGLQYVDSKTLADGHGWPPFLIDFPQWTGSDKLRRVTGWSNCRPLFTDSIHVDRVAYEASKATALQNIEKMNARWSEITAKSAGEQQRK